MFAFGSKSPDCVQHDRRANRMGCLTEDAKLQLLPVLKRGIVLRQLVGRLPWAAPTCTHHMCVAEGLQPPRLLGHLRVALVGCECPVPYLPASAFPRASLFLCFPLCLPLQNLLLLLFFFLFRIPFLNFHFSPFCHVACSSSSL